MIYVDGNLISVDEYHDEPVPDAYCVRCGDWINKSYTGWLCYSCFQNAMEKAES